MPEITVVIIHYGDYALTSACLNSVLRSNEAVSIIICDNASNVADQQLLHDHANYYFYGTSLTEKPLKGQIIWHRMGFNAGYAAAANAGIRIAKTIYQSYYILILNNDCTVHPACIKTLRHTYESLPDCGLLGAKVLFSSADGLINSVGGSFNKWTCWQKNIGAREVDAGQYSGLLKPDYVYGACMFISMKCIDTIGLMDERFLLYQEEHDWCIRALGKGYTNYTTCDALVFHQQGASSGKKIKQQQAPDYILALQYGNLIRLYLKHFPLLTPVAFIRLFMILAKRIVHRQYRHAFLLMKVIFGYRIHELPAS
ncbi:MAG: glycosyltransferase family 2 protein [Bacteroidota bacterium]